MSIISISSALGGFAAPTVSYQVATNIARAVHAQEMADIRRIVKIAPYLYEMEVAAETPADWQKWYDTYGGAEAGGCLSFRAHGFHARNYDWKFDRTAEFVVHVPATATRHASVGVANVGTNLTDEAVSKGLPSWFYRVIPGRMMDGINDAGVAINVNVVHAKGNEADLWPGREMSALGVVRYVLDNHTNAFDAAKWITEKVYIPAKYVAETGYSFHWMVSDERETYIVEDGAMHLIVGQADGGGELWYFDPVMSNYRLYSSASSGASFARNIVGAYDPYGCGIERSDVVRAGLSGVTDAASALDLLKAVWYSKAYPSHPAANPFWYTEFTSAAAGLTMLSPDAQLRALAAAADILYIKDRNESAATYRTGLSWQTVHSSVYDLTNRTLTVRVQEGDRNYDFTLLSSGGSGEGGVSPEAVREIVEPMIGAATNGVAYQVTTEPIPAAFTNKATYVRAVVHEGETRGEDEDGSVVIGKGAIGTVDPDYIHSLTNATGTTYLRSMSVAIGMNAKARPDGNKSAQAIAIGANSRAIGPNAIAIGSGAAHWYDTDDTSSAAVATGSQAIAIGYTAKAYGINAMQLGNGVNREPRSLKFLDTTIVKDGKVQATIDHFAVTAVTNANGTAMRDFKDLPVDYIVGGKTWEKTALTSSGIYGITFGGGLFVGCGYSSSDTGMWYSEDGIDWYQGDKTDGGFEAVCYGDGMFVASSSTDAGLWYSTNGINWAQGSAMSGNWGGIAYGDGHWVAAGKNSNGLWCSTNGIDWTQSTKTTFNWWGVCYGDGRFVASSGDNKGGGMWYSDDNGETWTQSNLTTSNDKYRAIAYGSGRFVTGNGSYAKEMLWSEDGATWHTATGSSIRVFGMVYARGRFLAAGYTAGLYYSDDGGETWVSSDPVGANGYWYGLAYGHGRVLAASISGGTRGVWYSDDRIIRDVPLVQQIKVNGTLVPANSNNVVNININYDYALGTLASGGSISSGEIRNITATADFTMTLSLGSSSDTSADCALWVDASGASADVNITSIGGGYTLKGDDGYSKITAGKFAIITFTRVTSSIVIVAKKEF